jgi:alanine racemase
MRGRLLVDLAAVTANYRSYCALHSGTTAAVVKADAYGLGSSAVASALHAAGCDTFFVALAEEGEALRAVLSQARILVFEGATSATAPLLAAADLIPVINNKSQLAAWRPYAGKPMAIHVDTGIGRLGFDTQVAAGQFADFKVAMLLTHLACADAPEHPQNELQLRAFGRVAARFPGVATSIGNSAGMCLGTEYCGDVARPGIGLYGGGFGNGDAPEAACVATLEGTVLQVREHPKNTQLGYGATYSTAAVTRVATVGLGYADGVPRLLSNRGEVAVGGVRCPILGRVSMDLTLVDVTSAPVETGDWVEFFGAVIPLDDVAGWAQTISYEVLTGIGSRVERSYLTGG